MSPTKPLAVALTAIFALAGCTAPKQTDSPYVDELDSPVRGLTQQEVDDFLAGNGAGFARAAELNGYPGPLHILELKVELDLSADQEHTIQALFDEMQGRARQAGADVLQAYEALESAFRDRTITAETLPRLTDAVDEAVNSYRTVHLEYHLRARPLLTEHQNVKYQELRGYGDGSYPHDGH